MNSFQLTALSVLVIVAGATIVAYVRRWIGRAACYFWCGVWLATAAACTWPDQMGLVANILGIDRGADLVSYWGIVVMFVGFWMVYIRLLRVRRELTLVVRKLAILEAKREYDLDDRSREV